MTRRIPHDPARISALGETMAERRLHGRADECAQIDDLIGRARGGTSATLLLRGPAGAGKSALCSYAAARAGPMTVITARGVQSEAQLAFAGLSELLRPILHHLPTIPPPQQAALGGALSMQRVDGVAPFVVNAATLSLLGAAAETSPLLAIVDDVHWLDDPSVEALTFAARRIEADNIAMVFVTRDEERRTALDDAGLPELWIGGLDAGASRTLLHSVHSHIADPVAARVITETAGIPLALLEIANALRPAQLAGRAPLDDPLPAGPRLTRLFHARVDALPDATRQALLVAATSGTRSMAVVVPALAELGLSADDLEPAERAGLVQLWETDLAFRHPVLRSAIYHGASGPARRAAHRALAHTLSSDRRAWHLAAATLGPDESVAQALAAAGREARRRGGFATAAAAFERAADRSRTPETRAEHLLEAAKDYEIAGRMHHAAALADAAAEQTTDPLLRADIHLVRGRIGIWTRNVQEARDMLVDEAERVASLDPARAALMHAEAVMACYMSGHITTGVRSAQRARDLSAPLGGHIATLGDLVAGHSLVLSGDSRTGYALLRSALHLFDDAAPVTLQQWFGYAGQCLTWLEDFAQARTLFDRMVSDARRHSALLNLAYALTTRSELEFRTGNWVRATADATESIRLSRELGQVALEGVASAALGLVAAVRGHEDECRDLTTRIGDIGARQGFASLQAYAASTVGILELSLGRPAAAIEHLEPLRSLVAELGLGEPATVLWAPDLVEAYVRVGRIDDAHDALTAFAAQADRTGRSWAHATSARCRGLLVDAGDCAAAFDGALRWHDALDMPFERARTELCYGEQLRRANRRVDAREHLRTALAVFDELGAVPWARRTRSELRAAGARAQRRIGATRPDALTPQELQVALTVAEGRSNKDAAAALFLSPKTVEFHLSNVYRKLGVASRTQLANRLARSTPPPADRHGQVRA